MRKSSYEEQISDALRKANRPATTPGTMFAHVLDALGETKRTASEIDAAWSAFYTAALRQELAEAEAEIERLQMMIDDYQTNF